MDSQIVAGSLEQNYLHPWLRKGSVHLIAGTSGTGKSRLLAQLMEALQAGAQEWLGLPLRPEPFVYIATDRAMSQVHEMWSRMAIRNWEKFPVIAAFDEDITLFPVWRELAEKMEPKPSIFIVEHWTRYIGSAKNDPGRVCAYMSDAGRWADKRGYTVIGVMEENKAKQTKDRYEDPRQRLAGVAEWGHLADTVFSLDKENCKDPSNPHRVLYVSDHNHTGRVIDLTFGELGRLVVQVRPARRLKTKP